MKLPAKVAESVGNFNGFLRNCCDSLLEAERTLLATSHLNLLKTLEMAKRKLQELLVELRSMVKKFQLLLVFSLCSG